MLRRERLVRALLALAALALAARRVEGVFGKVVGEEGLRPSFSPCDAPPRHNPKRPGMWGDHGAVSRPRARPVPWPSSQSRLGCRRSPPLAAAHRLSLPPLTAAHPSLAFFASRRVGCSLQFARTPPFTPNDATIRKRQTSPPPSPPTPSRPPSSSCSGAAPRRRAAPPPPRPTPLPPAAAARRRPRPTSARCSAPSCSPRRPARCPPRPRRRARAPRRASTAASPRPTSSKPILASCATRAAPTPRPRPRRLQTTVSALFCCLLFLLLFFVVLVLFVVCCCCGFSLGSVLLSLVCRAFFRRWAVGLPARATSLVTSGRRRPSNN